jgi:Tol biopolymer transport system component
MNKKAVISIVLFLFLGVSCTHQIQVPQSLPLATTSVATLPPTLTSSPTSAGRLTATPIPKKSFDIPKDALILYTAGQKLNVISATGGVPTSIVENPALVYYWSPSWSPDGNRITFAIWGPGITTQINIINSNGSGLRQLRKNTQDDPALSPDGEQIAYTSGKGLYVSSIDGSDLHLLADSIDSFFPSWSPDGKKLALLGGHQVIASMDLIKYI